MSLSKKASHWTEGDTGGWRAALGRTRFWQFEGEDRRALVPHPMLEGILLAYSIPGSGQPLGLERIFDGYVVDLMPLVETAHHFQGSDLPSLVGGMQEIGIDPEKLHTRETKSPYHSTGNSHVRGLMKLADIVGLNREFPRAAAGQHRHAFIQHGADLPATIESVLSQDYPRHRVHPLVDAGSTDGSLDILERHRDRLRWLTGKDKGPPTPLIADSWKPEARSSPG